MPVSALEDLAKHNSIEKLKLQIAVNKGHIKLRNKG